MKRTTTTNVPATKAAEAYFAALWAKSKDENVIAAAKAAIAKVVTDEAAAGNPGTGYEVQSTNTDGTLAVTRTGQPVTRSGMKPGTPFAIVAHREGRRTEVCTLWPCGTLDSAGPACLAL